MNKPIEYANICNAVDAAYAKRDAMIEAGDKIGVLAMDGAVDILEAMKSRIYADWQSLGGTSAVESIVIREYANTTNRKCVSCEAIDVSKEYSFRCENCLKTCKEKFESLMRSKARNVSTEKLIATPYKSIKNSSRHSGSEDFCYDLAFRNYEIYGDEE